MSNIRSIRSSAPAGPIDSVTNESTPEPQRHVLPTTSSFPNPAQDYYEGPLSLDRALIPRAASTFVVRVAGEALASLGIHDGDELVVDRALNPRRGRVLVVIADGPAGREHRVGIFDVIEGQAVLTSDIETIALSADVEPWGVATFAIKHLLPAAARARLTAVPDPPAPGP